MARAKKRVSRKAGLPPGSLVHIGEKKSETTRITVFRYDETRVEEKGIEKVEDCFSLEDTFPVTWINIDAIHDVEILQKIGTHFGLHPLVLEDIVNTAQRPKIEDHTDYIYIVFKMFSYDDERHVLSSEQVSIVLAASNVLSFQERVGNVFDPVRNRIRAGGPRLRKGGPDYLTYALLDTIVDSYFIILEKLDERIEWLEEKTMTDLSSETLRKIHSLRRELVVLGKSAWPLREIVGYLEREKLPLVQEGTGLFLRDLYDHTVQVIETIEVLRERVSGLQEIYLAGLSNRMNSVMKVLTIIATIFIPLTFIAGIYGMNFKHMPELEWRWGYPLALVIMAAVGVSMLVYFARKKWL